MTQWTNHFSSIATSQSHSNSAVVEVCKKIPNLTSLSKLNSDDIVDDDFTVEVELALNKLDNLKAECTIFKPHVVCICETWQVLTLKIVSYLSMVTELFV